MQVHADRIFDDIRLARLLLRRLRGARLDELLDVVFADDLHAESLENLQILVALDRVDDRRRKYLIELLVSDIAAVRLAAALHLLNDAVELGLAENRHALHRRQHGILSAVTILILRSGGLHRNIRQLLVILLLGLALVALDLGGELVGIQLKDIKLLRRNIITVEIGVFRFAPALLAANRRFTFGNLCNCRFFFDLLFSSHYHSSI